MRRGAERNTYTSSFVLNFGSAMCVNFNNNKKKEEKIQDLTQDLTS